MIISNKDIVLKQMKIIKFCLILIYFPCFEIKIFAKTATRIFYLIINVSDNVCQILKLNKSRQKLSKTLLVDK